MVDRTPGRGAPAARASKTLAASLIAVWSIACVSGLAAAQTPAGDASASRATQQPVIGPPAAWVTPISLPAATAESGEAPVRVLLHDQQAFLEAGRQTTYTEIAVKIQAPAGLGAGNLSLPWRPETSVLTVHKLEIRRGDQVIDVLGSGQTFTVIRREQNLESAVLDGVLTANIQPEGLQVGDILDVATTLTTTDPVLGDHVEQLGAAWNVLPIMRAHLSVQWPEALRVTQRVTSALPPVRLSRRAGMMKFDLSLDNVEPARPPNGAPPRFALGRLAEFTSFGSWADLGALLAPLYERAAVLPAEGPLRAEAMKIRDQSPDPIVRAQAALALVQDRIRYVALAMGEGGLTPAAAETTWARRFGDCKAKTALLIAILRALDIEAEPVAVSSAFGDGLDQRLPTVGVFNHVLVRATIAGKAYWLDGTRSGDTRLQEIQTPNFGWGLPLAARGAQLVRMQPAPLETPDQSISVAIDASAGLTPPAPIRAEYIVRGDSAVAGNIAYSSLSADARDGALRDYWREQHADLDIASVSVAFDPAKREQRFVMDGRIRMDWSRGSYRPDDMTVGYRVDFTRDPGPQSDAPFSVHYPFYTHAVETVRLPPGQRGFQVHGGEAVDQTVAGVAYRRRAAIEDGVFRVEASARGMAPEFPAAEAPAAQAALRALANRVVYLAKPSDYLPTEADLAVEAASPPTDVAGFLRRASLYMVRNRLDEAMADYDRAVALDPDNAQALASRGMAHAVKGDADAAKRDLDRAAALAPNAPSVLAARGYLAQQTGRTSDAIAEYSRALAIDPNNVAALGGRALAYGAAGEYDHALADSSAALQRGARGTELHLLRANVFRRRGDNARAAAEADALAAAAEGDAYAHVVAARIYAESDRRAEAMREFDRAIAIEPEAYIYVNRARSRPASDAAGRRADLDAALALDPNLAEALELEADLLDEQHDYEAAVRALSAAIRNAPNDPRLRLRRGVSYARAGRRALADADFAAARARAANAADLNNLCWTKATAGVALESALADCDAALAQTPDTPAILDSRAFVLLRLGRADDAIAAYDRALSRAPNMAAALFGRGLAWELKGDQTKADADMAAALRINQSIRAEFEGYGLRPRSSR